MTGKEISTVIVLYHSQHLVRRIIDNLYQKVGEVKEIILVDNSSDDLTEFESDQVKILNGHGNIGYGAAINLGVRAASYDCILIVNPDIEIEEWETPYENLTEAFMLVSGKPVEWSKIRKFPKLSYDLLRLSVMNLSSIFSGLRCLSPSIDISDITEPKKVDWVSGALILTNKKTMTAIGGFDEDYFLFYEELDLCKRALAKGISSYVLPSVQFKLNGGTSSKGNVNTIKFKSEIDSAKLYHSKYSGKKKTFIGFMGFKLFCVVTSWVMRALSVLSSGKIREKANQYKVYAGKNV